jgi:hypothetical protein
MPTSSCQVKRGLHVPGLTLPLGGGRHIHIRRAVVPRRFPIPDSRFPISDVGNFDILPETVGRETV